MAVCGFHSLAWASPASALYAHLAAYPACANISTKVSAMMRSSSTISTLNVCAISYVVMYFTLQLLYKTSHSRAEFSAFSYSLRSNAVFLLRPRVRASLADGDHCGAE